MLIALPHNRDALPEVEAALTPATLARWTSALKPRDNIKLRLPRFHASTEFDLRGPAMRLGVRRLFDTRAELPGLLSDRRLFLSNIVQRVRIDVDEAGTEASAATGGDFMVNRTT